MPNHLKEHCLESTLPLIGGYIATCIEKARFLPALLVACILSGCVCCGIPSADEFHHVDPKERCIPGGR